MLKFEFNSPNRPKIVYIKPHANFFLFTESEKDLMEKIREDKVGRLSSVLTRTAIVDKTFFAKNENMLKTIFGIDVTTGLQRIFKEIC